MEILVIHHIKTDTRYYKIISRSDFWEDYKAVVDNFIESKYLYGDMTISVYTEDGALIAHERIQRHRKKSN